MKTFEELEQDVIAWADNLGIFAKSDPVSQMLKTASEVGELCDDINKGRLEDAKVELGDVIVTLILQCKMHNTSISVVLNRESWYDN
ncbi:MAG: MazG-like family protein, partial [Methylotenera sp.]